MLIILDWFIACWYDCLFFFFFLGKKQQDIGLYQYQLENLILNNFSPQNYNLLNLSLTKIKAVRWHDQSPPVL